MPSSASDQKEPTKTAAASSNAPASSTSAASDGWKTYASDAVMQASSDANETVILASDTSLNWVCSSATWQMVKLNTSLNGRQTSGAGCYIEYTFTGDRVQVFGGQSTQTGIFGCVVDDNPLWSQWWDASSNANVMLPYKGMCDIAGIGYGKHTIRYANSPYKAKSIVFTGLRYRKDSSSQPWSNPSIAGCCAEFTFPSGASTALAGAAGSTTDASTDTNWNFVFSIVVAVVALSGLAGVILGALMCKRKPTVNPVLAALKSRNAESRPLRRRRKKHKPRVEPMPREDTASTSSASDDNEKEKKNRSKTKIETSSTSSGSSDDADTKHSAVARHLRSRQPFRPLTESPSAIL